jgi:hypothetical protein
MCKEKGGVAAAFVKIKRKGSKSCECETYEKYEYCN